MKEEKVPSKGLCIALICLLLLYCLSGCFNETHSVSFEANYSRPALNKDKIKDGFQKHGITITEEIKREKENDYGIRFKFKIRSPNSSREYDLYDGYLEMNYPEENENYTSEYFGSSYFTLGLEEEHYPNYPPSTTEENGLKRAKRYKPIVRRGGEYMIDVINETTGRRPFDTEINIMYSED